MCSYAVFLRSHTLVSAGPCNPPSAEVRRSCQLGRRVPSCSLPRRVSPPTPEYNASGNHSLNVFRWRSSRCPWTVPETPHPRSRRKTRTARPRPSFVLRCFELFGAIGLRQRSRRSVSRRGLGIRPAAIVPFCKRRNQAGLIVESAA